MGRSACIQQDTGQRALVIRLLKPVATLVAPIVLVAIGFTWWMAVQADDQRRRLAQGLIASHLAQRLDRLERIAIESQWLLSAVSPSTSASSALPLDPRAIGDRLASWVSELHAIDLIAILDADNRPIYLALFGHLADAVDPPLATFAWVGQARDEFNGLESHQAVSGVVTDSDDVHLAVVIPLPASIAQAWGAVPDMMMVVTEPFDLVGVTAVARAASVASVRMVRGDGGTPFVDGPWVTVRDVSGYPIGELRWETTSAFAQQWPLLGFIAAMVTGLAMIAVMLAVQAAREVERREKALTDFVESASDWLWQTDASERIAFLSPRFYTDTGLSPDTVIGKRPRDLLARPGGLRVPRSRRNPERWAPFREIVRGLRTVHGDLRLVQLSGTPILGRGGLFQGYRGTATDVTERYRAEQHIRFLAEHDPLTGLLNRKAFETRLEQALAHARRFGPRSALLVLDLNDFKTVNDTLGHPAGDRLLVVIADRLRVLARETDVVARLGGDEFAILLSEVEAVDEALAFAARVRAAMVEPTVIDGEPFGITFAIGIAFCPERPGLDADGWMRRADLALFRAKGESAEPVQVFRHAYDEQRRRKLTRRHDLARALERGEFHLRYQPQVDLIDGRIAGVEALLRWHHADRGWISPEVFIPEAEACGLILPIGLWVIEQACRDARAWEDAGLTFGRVAVNLSPMQFGASDIVGEVETALRLAGLDGRRLELEITEGVLMRETEVARDVLTRLDAIDVTIALDDFGTGYSSLAYLRGFPLHRLKIDQAFVREVASDPDAAAITRAIVQLGHSLRLSVLGEGVETTAQRHELRLQGCDSIQGHLIAAPMSADALADFIQAYQGRESVAAVGD